VNFRILLQGSSVLSIYTYNSHPTQ